MGLINFNLELEWRRIQNETTRVKESFPFFNLAGQAYISSMNFSSKFYSNYMLMIIKFAIEIL